jgi:signal transduction histidine kinase
VSMFESSDTVPGPEAWLTRAMLRALTAACGCPTATELLSLWAVLVATARPGSRVALFLRESEGWTLTAPPRETGEPLSIGEETLALAASQEKSLLVDALRPPGAAAALASFAARGTWRGVLALWSDRGSLSETAGDDAETIALAIGETLTALRRSETSREKAVAADRERVAAELHDGFLATLRSARLHAQLAIKDAQDDPEKALSWLERTEKLLGTTSVEARKFLLGLRKLPDVEELVPWLQDYASDFARENDVAVDLRVSGDNRLTRAQAYEATRLVRQALGNVGDHAHARNASVMVLFGNHATTISVADDGAGFDVESTLKRAMDSSRNGIRGMRYRIESIGGEMHILSRPGEGTTVTFRLRHGSKSDPGTIPRFSKEPV